VIVFSGELSIIKVVDELALTDELAPTGAVAPPSPTSSPQEAMLAAARVTNALGLNRLLIALSIPLVHRSVADHLVTESLLFHG
jgi:hypothetical protein